MLSRFHLIPERNEQTDRFAISISRVSMLTRDKNLDRITGKIGKSKGKGTGSTLWFKKKRANFGGL